MLHKQTFNPVTNNWATTNELAAWEIWTKDRAVSSEYIGRSFTRFSSTNDRVKCQPECGACWFQSFYVGHRQRVKQIVVICQRLFSYFGRNVHCKQLRQIFSRQIYTTRLNPLTPTAAIWVQLHPVPDRVKPLFVIFWHPGTLTLRVEHQSARMSKITNDGLTQSGTRCFIAVPIWQQWASKG